MSSAFPFQIRLPNSIDLHRFYFASQVLVNGGPVPYPEVDGPAHGEVYWNLVEGKASTNGWDVRFIVDGDGNVVVQN